MSKEWMAENPYPYESGSRIPHIAFNEGADAQAKALVERLDRFRQGHVNIIITQRVWRKLRKDVGLEEGQE